MTPSSFAVLALITLRDMDQEQAEAMTKRIHSSIWDAMPERPQPDAMVILFDGTPIHRIFNTKALRAPYPRVEAAHNVMRSLFIDGHMVERMKVRNWLAALRAGRMKPEAFDDKLATMRAWLSAQKRKRRRKR